MANERPDNRKRVLVISHVLPFPGQAGQERRVYFTLRSLRKRFHVTFLTFERDSRVEDTAAKLADLCDEVICLESLYAVNRLRRLYFRCVAAGASLLSSLKPSNYIIGRLEFSPRRISQAIGDRKFDLVLYEYWHAHESLEFFKKRGIPCVLDMHNILWSSLQSQQQRNAYVPQRFKERRLGVYKRAEENAWKKFDAIVAINRVEENYVKAQTINGRRTFYAPMGIDLETWQYTWKRDQKHPKIAYYGGLGTPHNEESALRCFRKIMPSVWSRFSNAEFWIVGSNPSKKILSLPSIDDRVKVTGFVKDAPAVLGEMSVVVCPWKGRYGFRSRLVEVMALGVPLVTTPEAIDGMELKDKRDVLLGEDEEAMALHTLELLGNEDIAARQSEAARHIVEQIYSTANTYDRLSGDLLEWLGSGNQNSVD